jgi:hypothetical protein
LSVLQGPDRSCYLIVDAPCSLPACVSLDLPGLAVLAGRLELQIDFALVQQQLLVL